MSHKNVKMKYYFIFSEMASFLPNSVCQVPPEFNNCFSLPANALFGKSAIHQNKSCQLDPEVEVGQGTVSQWKPTKEQGRNQNLTFHARAITTRLSFLLEASLLSRVADWFFFHRSWFKKKHFSSPSPRQVPNACKFTVSRNKGWGFLEHTWGTVVPNPHWKLSV